jgi:hypothetical protein
MPGFIPGIHANLITKQGVECPGNPGHDDATFVRELRKHPIHPHSQSFGRINLHPSIACV